MTVAALAELHRAAVAGIYSTARPPWSPGTLSAAVTAADAI